MGQYFHDLMSELAYRKRTLEDRPKLPEGSPGKDKEINKREAKRAKRKEAKYVALLLKIGGSTNWNQHDRQSYLLPTKWLNRWKKHIEYEEFVNKHKAVHFGASSAALSSPAQDTPGPITCTEIMADSKEYFHNYSCPEALCNFVIKEGMEEGKDYLTISKELWKYLKNKYDGNPFARYQINIGNNGMKKLDLKLSRVHFLFAFL